MTVFWPVLTFAKYIHKNTRIRCSLKSCIYNIVGLFFFMGVLPPQMVYTIFSHRKSKSVDCLNTLTPLPTLSILPFFPPQVPRSFSSSLSQITSSPAHSPQTTKKSISWLFCSSPSPSPFPSSPLSDEKGKPQWLP